jgi:para-nitrobenzyl esterase
MSTAPVRTSLGPVRGQRRADGTLRFLGIPYARPPIGPLRFAAPVPPRPWTEPRDATGYGPTAQRRPFAAVTTVPEPSIPGDGVLNLNVFTPAADRAAALPVLVWIHGGGFVAGSAASPWYDGAAFNRDGVVLVSIGYRLGVEGFLHLPDAPDNRAVRDWLAALGWVRENIAAFGGDPDRVTIAGQSAGGTAVQTLLATPAAEGLFRAAICASASTTGHLDRETAYAASAGLTAASLQNASIEQLLALEDRLRPFGPFPDGELIPDPVRDALLAGAPGTRKPLMLGYTTHEFGDVEQIFRSPALALAQGRAQAGCPTWLYEFGWPATADRFRGLAHHCADLPFAFDLLAAPGVPEALGARPPQALADEMHGAWVRFVADLDPGASWPCHTPSSRAVRLWADPSALLTV